MLLGWTLWSQKSIYFESVCRYFIKKIFRFSFCSLERLMSKPLTGAISDQFYRFKRCKNSKCRNNASALNSILLEHLYYIPGLCMQATTLPPYWLAGWDLFCFPHTPTDKKHWHSLANFRPAKRTKGSKCRERLGRKVAMSLQEAAIIMHLVHSTVAQTDGTGWIY